MLRFGYAKVLPYPSPLKLCNIFQTLLTKLFYSNRSLIKKMLRTLSIYPYPPYVTLWLRRAFTPPPPKIMLHNMWMMPYQIILSLEEITFF
jgi:hypothetical protein